MPGPTTADSIGLPPRASRGSLTVFERRERNGIDYYRTSPDAPWQALNIDSLNFSGVESALHFVATRTQTIDFRYTWMLGTQDTVPIGYTKYSFNYPTDSGVVAWQGDFHGLLCRSRLGVLKRRDRDPYALWDIYAGLSRGQLHPFLQTLQRHRHILRRDSGSHHARPHRHRRRGVGPDETLIFRGHA